jgi:uncharacterized protein YndB with AHSA1/START domain
MIEVTRSTTIRAPAARVWALLRDFNAMPAWNATIRSSTIEDGPADRIGCRRVLTFDDGSVWTHALAQLSDTEMKIGYAIVGIPPGTRIPMRDYRAVIRVEPAADGTQCRVTWSATLETEQEDAVRTRAEAVFQAGFDGLARAFGG